MCVTLSSTCAKPRLENKVVHKYIVSGKTIKGTYTLWTLIDRVSC